MKDRRRAVVVGSGPGGITAALTLDGAGFEVVLLEAAEVLAPGLLASGTPARGNSLGIVTILRAGSRDRASMSGSESKRTST